MKQVIFVETEKQLNSFIIDSKESDISYIDVIGNGYVILITLGNGFTYVFGIKHHQIKCFLTLDWFTNLIDLYFQETKKPFFVKNVYPLLDYINDYWVLDSLLDVDVYLHFQNNLYNNNLLDKEEYKRLENERLKIENTVKQKVSETILNLLNLVEVSIKFYNEFKTKLLMDESNTEFNLSVSKFNYLNKLSLCGIYDTNSIEVLHYLINSISKRPSLKRKFNYLSLNKTDGSREKIKSRYENGKIIEIDFQSYHLQLLDHLLNLFPDKDINFNYHNEMSKVLLGKDIETEEDRQDVKTKIFYLMYNDKNDYLDKDNPIIQKIINFRNKLIIYYNNNGRIPSAKSKGYIYFNEQVTDNRVFNYLMQDLETNTNLEILRNLYIKYKTKYNLILYVYDSFLFDVRNEDVEQFLIDIKSLLSNFIFRIKMGTNYNNLELING